jgi:hypothetical protein
VSAESGVPRWRGALLCLGLFVVAVASALAGYTIETAIIGDAERGIIGFFHGYILFVAIVIVAVWLGRERYRRTFGSWGWFISGIALLPIGGVWALLVVMSL